MSDWILQHIKQFRKYVPTEPVYLRYGIWHGHSKNHTTNESERGLSVYRARVVDGIVYLDDDPSTQLDDQGRVVFAVQGRERFTGSDGEPVLQNVRLIRLPIAISAKRT